MPEPSGRTWTVVLLSIQPARTKTSAMATAARTIVDCSCGKFIPQLYLIIPGISAEAKKNVSARAVRRAQVTLLEADGDHGCCVGNYTGLAGEQRKGANR